MRSSAGALLLLFNVFAFSLAAQTSTNYQNEEHALNSGGNPAPALTSSNYQVTLSSIGDGLTAPGLNSVNYRMEGGFDAAYPPPAEVLNLRFPAKTILTWIPEPSVGSYGLYRGALTDLPGSYGSRVQSGLTSPTATDTAVPGPGQGLFYLVTASNRLGEEGTKGNDSTGAPRP